MAITCVDYDYYGYVVYAVQCKGDKAGTATIKVKVCDGTNKTVSFKVKVVK